MSSTYGALLLVQILFGLWPVAASGVMAEVSPLALVGFRTLLGAPLMFALIAGARRPQPLGALLRLAGLGLLGVTANQILYIQGLSLAGPINASILVTTIPIATLIAAMLFRQEDLRPNRVLGVGLAMFGVWILVGAEQLELGGRFLGSLLILGNTTSYGLYLVFARRVVAEVGALTAVAWVFGFGALFALPFTGGPVLETSWMALSPSTWLGLVFILLGPTVGTYFLNAYALKRADSSVVAVFIGLQPLIGGLAAWFAFGERMSLRGFVAAALIVLGVALTALLEGRGRPNGSELRAPSPISE